MIQENRILIWDEDVIHCLSTNFIGSKKVVFVFEADFDTKLEEYLVETIVRLVNCCHEEYSDPSNGLFDMYERFNISYFYYIRPRTEYDPQTFSGDNGPVTVRPEKLC